MFQITRESRISMADFEEWCIIISAIDTKKATKLKIEKKRKYWEGKRYHFFRSDFCFSKSSPLSWETVGTERCADKRPSSNLWITPTISRIPTISGSNRSSTSPIIDLFWTFFAWSPSTGKIVTSHRTTPVIVEIEFSRSLAEEAETGESQYKSSWSMSGSEEGEKIDSAENPISVIASFILSFRIN